MRTNRRQFFNATGSFLVAGSLPLASSQSKEPPALLPIVDTHQHLWDLDRFQPPWLKDAPPILAKSYVTKDYLAATAGVNLTQAVYMEIDVAPRQQLQEAEHVIALSRSEKHPTSAAVISGRPNSPQFESYIQRFKDVSEIKGIRQVLHVDSAARGLCLEPTFVRSMQLLGKLGKSFDLCMRPTELSDGKKLAAQCPDTRFIIDHCGNADPKAFLRDGTDEKPWHQPDQWKRDMDALAGLPNTICKISGIVARAPKGWSAEHLAPIIDFCLLQFGPERVVFGGDWPVCLLGSPYANWVSALKEVISQRAQKEQRQLLHDNAVRLYGLG
ncbi:MAG: amidohydrolase [Planctomycetaceae bacterium]|nr:amidohydrolase [Planctomycetaceae bacterium]